MRAASDRDSRVLRQIQRVVTPPGALADTDLRCFLNCLYLATRQFRPRRVVQAGTGCGLSSLAIALAFEAEGGPGHLVTIDPEPHAYHGIPHPIAWARTVIRAARVGHRISLVRGYSTLPLDAGRMVLVNAPTWRLPALRRAGGFDMLVVDGDHTFLGCYLDLTYGARLLDPRGPRIIVCHDYLGIPDVHRAVQRWSETARPRAEVVFPTPCGIKVMQI